MIGIKILEKFNLIQLSIRFHYFLFTFYFIERNKNKK